MRLFSLAYACVGPRPLRTRAFSDLEGVINSTFERLDQMGNGTVDAATLTTALQVHEYTGCLTRETSFGNRAPTLLLTSSPSSAAVARVGKRVHRR